MAVPSPPLKEFWPTFKNPKSTAGRCCGTLGPFALRLSPHMLTSVSVCVCGNGADSQPVPRRFSLLLDSFYPLSLSSSFSHSLTSPLSPFDRLSDKLPNSVRLTFVTHVALNLLQYKSPVKVSLSLSTLYATHVYYSSCMTS